jgi:hypothetical protein
MIDDDGPEPASPHRWLGYDTASGGRFRARCSCGWRSNPYPTAGLAGSAWDAHVSEDPPGDD